MRIQVQGVILGTVSLFIAAPIVILTSSPALTQSALGSTSVSQSTLRKRQVRLQPLTRIARDCSNLPEVARAFAVRKKICNPNIIQQEPPKTTEGSGLSPQDPIRMKPSTRSGVTTQATPSVGDCGTITTYLLPSGISGVATVIIDLQSNLGDILGVSTWQNSVINNTTGFVNGVGGPTVSAGYDGPNFSDFNNVLTGPGNVSTTNFFTVANTAGGYCVGLGATDTLDIP